MLLLSQLKNDFSFSALVAGFVAVLVGFASAIAIVFQAAKTAGADQAMLESWVWALGIGMGLSSMGLSLWYKRPLIIAWSTPGAALIAATSIELTMAQAVGVFLFVGLMILLTGVSGLFSRLSKAIPSPIASAMLAGILLNFGIHLFTALRSEVLLVGVMLLTYIVARMFVPRLAIAFVLFVAIVMVLMTGQLELSSVSITFSKPVFVIPEFSLSLLIGLGIPLFLVTMSSQNLPGVAVLKASGYSAQNISPVISVTGISTLLLSPFGGFTFNLAAITAAICTSEEAHENIEQRYIAGVSAGIFNLLTGVFASAVVGIFVAFPEELVLALAGLALIGVIGNSLKMATEIKQHQDAAILTFLVCASGVSFWEISSAFWGLVLGMTVVVSHKLFTRLKRS
ncbi:benzoate/H(+) symporter BenE family transporter [Agaribacter flavus]|uniref:Benzoate/H(+) symporter BenE family transporter n=1 Tax=Agaribacter flavus TaxID=1902781 RepID=A0ABV7FK08_9ALTE